jgi:hypothetical protein
MKGKKQLTTEPTHPENRAHQAHSLMPGFGLEAVTDDRLIALVKFLARKAASDDYRLLLAEQTRANEQER